MYDKSLNPVEIDQDLRLGQSHVQERHKALAACQELGVVAVLSQRVERLGQRFGIRVRKRWRFQRRLPLRRNYSLL